MSLIQEIRRFSSDIVGEEQLVKMLEKSAAEKRPLRVKFGIDPTFPEVHLGHAVPIRLLRLFQEHGHLPVLILGDGTARLGDPTGRNDQRPPLTPEMVEENAKTYLVQIGKLLDLSEGVCEVRRNNEWFSKMDFFDCLQLAAKSTAARLLERDDFQKRMQANLPVHLHEMMYPLMQGLDSVKVEADVELGGNDQLFNLHMGRQMQEREGQRPQVCITTPLLLGTDGRKMSKSYGNHVGLNASSDDMFGKVMSLSDEGMATWFSLATQMSTQAIDAQLAGHPREAKDCLARAVVTELHSAEAAAAASEEFVRRFQKKEKPSDVPEKLVAAGAYSLPSLMKAVGLANTTSEARRMIEGGGVRIDDEVIKDVRYLVALEESGASVLMQAGKRHFAKISAE
ncbi:MAG: tyrosine--tRNA ligase [Planctomycetota bacterium]|nr:tyrosine--tRNA ligase [Planctomycetota bacterium]MDA1112951.1 tyrosine--tRNA ligase [Planctomycetota bacterium]